MNIKSKCKKRSMGKLKVICAQNTIIWGPDNKTGEPLVAVGVSEHGYTRLKAHEKLIFKCVIRFKRLQFFDKLKKLNF